MLRDIFRLRHRVGNDGSIVHGIRNFDISSVVYGDISGVMLRDILRLRQRVGNDGGIVHGIRNLNIGRIVYGDISGVMLRDILRLRLRVGNDGGVMHSHILRQRHRIGHDGCVMHSIRHLNVGRVTQIHRINSSSGLREHRRRRCRFRLHLVIGELSAERQPDGVARVQGMNIDMGDGIEALHPVGLGDGVDRLSFLHDVHKVLATVQHLGFKAHFDRRGAGLLRPSREVCQQ